MLQLGYRFLKLDTHVSVFRIFYADIVVFRDLFQVTSLKLQRESGIYTEKLSIYHYGLLFTALYDMLF